ncbi:MAG: hypothetical protein R3Y47_08815 [Lachnospiraceae bacterium]
MIDFSEELKKFHKSTELGELEEEVYQKNTSDLTKLVVSLLQEKNKK